LAAISSCLLRNFYPSRNPYQEHPNQREQVGLAVVEEVSVTVVVEEADAAVEHQEDEEASETVVDEEASQEAAAAAVSADEAAVVVFQEVDEAEVALEDEEGVEKCFLACSTCADWELGSFPPLTITNGVSGVPSDGSLL